MASMQKKHETDVDDLLNGKMTPQQLVTKYALTTKEITNLQRDLCSIAEIIKGLWRLFVNAERRQTGIYFTFEDDIDKPGDYIKEYSFIANLTYMYPQIFPDCDDNHNVTDLFRKIGVTTPSTINDTEACCCYFYFKTKRSAETFIVRLNKFFQKRIRNNS